MESRIPAAIDALAEVIDCSPDVRLKCYKSEQGTYGRLAGTETNRHSDRGDAGVQQSSGERCPFPSRRELEESQPST